MAVWENRGDVMSDLVKRLREPFLLYRAQRQLANEAADRIKELEAFAMRVKNHDDYFDHIDDAAQDAVSLFKEQEKVMSDNLDKLKIIGPKRTVPQAEYILQLESRIEGLEKIRDGWVKQNIEKADRIEELEAVVDKVTTFLIARMKQDIKNDFGRKHTAELALDCLYRAAEHRSK